MAKVMPALIEFVTAVSSALDAVPVRLMFATACSDVVCRYPVDAGDTPAFEP